MTFRQFAFNNVTRNKRLYAAYFLSSMFIVMVFFTFAIFTFHPNLNIGSVGGNVSIGTSFGLNVAGGIIYVFSFFFVLYSMSSFLQSRKKEFGLLMVQGMSTRQIRLMVFLENMLIGFFATLGGILLGLVFAKGVLLLAENVLIISAELNFYFPLKAIILTFISFIILFLIISFFVSFILRTKKLIDLIKGDKQSKGEPKASILLTIIAIILLGSGYFTALYVKGMDVFYAMLPVIVVVIIGTYLLFTQLSVYVIRRLKKREGIFWRKTNMLLFSDLAFRMKDNARVFFMVSIISTVAFSAIGTLFGFQSYLTGGMKETNTFTFVYSAYDDDEKVAEDIERVEQTLIDQKIEVDKAEVELHYFSTNNDDMRTLIAKQSDYNRFAKLIGKEEVNLQDGQAIVVKPSIANMMQEEKELTLMKEPIELGDGTKVQPYKMMETNALPEIQAYYIVNDDAYAKLPTPVNITTSYAWQAKKGQEDRVLAAGELFSEMSMYELTAVDYIVYEINKMYGPVMFVGLFIGLIFFISAGSFLYFRLYTDLDEDKQKFKSIAKMGLTINELKKVINRQTALLFFAPIIVALLHGAVALTALSHLFGYDLFHESALVLGSFFAIQVVYFFIVRYFYTKQIKAAIQ